MLNIFLFIFFREGKSLRWQKRFKFYLNKVWHHFHGFKESNMIWSWYINILCHNVAGFKTIVLSSRIRIFNTIEGRGFEGGSDEKECGVDEKLLWLAFISLLYSRFTYFQKIFNLIGQGVHNFTSYERTHKLLLLHHTSG